MADDVPDAWVGMPSEDDLRRFITPDRRMPYDFGFLPAMTRLMLSHGRIGRAMAQLFAEIMFSPEGTLSRRERELVAAVTAAAQDCHY